MKAVRTDGREECNRRVPESRKAQRGTERVNASVWCRVFSTESRWAVAFQRCPGILGVEATSAGLKG